MDPLSNIQPYYQMDELTKKMTKLHVAEPPMAKPCMNEHRIVIEHDALSKPHNPMAQTCIAKCLKKFLELSHIHSSRL